MLRNLAVCIQFYALAQGSFADELCLIQQHASQRGTKNGHLALLASQGSTQEVDGEERYNGWQPYDWWKTVINPKKELAIASAMFGGRDNFTLPSCPTSAHCFFFTDDLRTSNKSGWHVDNTPHHEIFAKKYDWLDAHGPYSWGNVSNGKNNQIRGIMTAKFYKMNAHLLPGLQNYKIILWMDTHFWNTKCWTDFSWNPNLLENLRTDLQNSNMMIPLHPLRKTVSAEVIPAGGRADIITGEHTGKQDAQRAFEHEKADGFADDAGLFWNTIFAYKTQDQQTTDALLAWWREVQMYSFRDQISFPYIKDKFHLKLYSGKMEILLKDISPNATDTGHC